MRPYIKTRFFAKVRKDKSGCWLFEACRDRLGYGAFRLRGKIIRSHRVAWELHNGPIPSAAHVLHKCDVRNCVNPEHLYIGTHADNMRDRRDRGRDRLPKPIKGEKHHKAVLTERIVREMRLLRSRDGLYYRQIAAIFNVNFGTAYAAINRASWREVA